MVLVLIFLILLGFTGYSLWKTFFPSPTGLGRGQQAQREEDLERNELPSSLSSSVFVITSLHLSSLQQQQQQSDYELSSDGFHSPPATDSPPPSSSSKTNNTTNKKSFSLPRLRQQLFASLRSNKKQGLYEMVSIDDMNSSHPFQILGSDEELEEEQEQQQQEKRQRDDALEFLKSDEEKEASPHRSSNNSDSNNISNEI